MNTTTTATTTTETAIHTRAMLVKLTIATWSARKYDKGATAKVIADHGARRDTARVNKFLLPSDATAYKALTSLATSIRAAHYGHTLAWADEGWRLLPTMNFQTYSAWYRAQQTAFQRALGEFVQEYPRLWAEAEQWLNGLYRAEDYPAPGDMPGRFRLGVEFSPVPAAGDIRVDLGAEMRAEIEQSVMARVEGATRVAMADAWERLHGVVACIAERLSDPSAIFRDTLIGNAREVCDTLKRLNVTGDPDLEAMRARVEAELTQTAPDVLRDTPRTRAATAAKAQDIMGQMSAFYAPQGGAL